MTAPSDAPRPPTAPAADPAGTHRPVDLRPLVLGPFGDLLPRGEGTVGHYSVRDQWDDLTRIPQHPRKVFNWRHVLALVKRTTDFFGHRRGWFGTLLNRVNPYPPPFLRVDIPSADGTVIRGWLGLQPTRRPGILIVPGMFSSKDDTVHKAKAIRIWRRWNYNVLIIDLRGFGLSQGSPNTPGWKESEDVLAAARFLDSFNSVSVVGVLGESLGATASLLAAAQEGRWAEETMARIEGRAVPIAPETPRDAPPPTPAPAPHTAGDVPVPPPPQQVPRRVIQAVLAFSPFADARSAVEHIDRMPPRRDPFYHVHRLFIRLLMLHTRGRHREFQRYMAASAAHYGVTLDTLYARSALRHAVQQVRCPALVIHAEDDPTVPVGQARMLQAAVRDRADMQVWVVPWGRHVEFELLDRRWYWRVVSRFMGQWVGR